jgi:hypothetical protein
VQLLHTLCPPLRRRIVAASGGWLVVEPIFLAVGWAVIRINRALAGRVQLRRRPSAETVSVVP